jgi:predicted NACHT family NTPase
MDLQNDPELEQPERSNILVTGCVGTGKTTFCQLLAKAFAQEAEAKEVPYPYERLNVGDIGGFLFDLRFCSV